MAGHNLEITIKSTGQIDAITISDEAVDLLMPGTPAESVAQAKELIIQALAALFKARSREIVDAWKNDNVTIST